MLWAALATGQSFQNAGSTGAQFLKIGVGARAMGMGGASASIEGGVTALAWNPAALGRLDAIAVSVEHNAWVEGITHNFVGVVVPVSDQVTLGFHTVFLGTGDIEITTIDQPEGTGSFYDASDISAGLTTTVRLTTQLAFATTVKYVQEQIYEMTSGGVAVDAGAFYETGFRSLNLGFSLSNLGFEQSFTGRPLEVKYDPPAPGEPQVGAELETMPFVPPLVFRASGSFDVFTMFDEPSPDHRLLAALDFVQQSDTPERLALGMEYTWANLLSLRSGYLFNADELSWGAGAGVRIALSEVVVSADYAANSIGRFGLAHRFGLTLQFGD
jgi:hypothetical protein